MGAVKLAQDEINTIISHVSASREVLREKRKITRIEYEYLGRLMLKLSTQSPHPEFLPQKLREVVAQ